MRHKTLEVIAASLLILGSSACAVDAPSAPASAGRDPLAYSARGRDGADRLAPTTSSTVDTLFVLRRVAPLGASVGKPAESAMTFPVQIHRFSGYLVSSGRSGAGIRR